MLGNRKKGKPARWAAPSRICLSVSPWQIRSQAASVAPSAPRQGGDEQRQLGAEVLGFHRADRIATQTLSRTLLAEFDLGTITTSQDLDSALTIHTVEGEVTFDQILTKIREYNSGEVTLKTLWDFRACRVPNLSTQELRAGLASLVASLRDTYQDLPGRRRAVVTHEQLNFGMVRMWDAYAELKTENRVFYDIDQARAWLD